MTGGQWRKVVVDVKVTSTDKMNEAFKEKDDKYREWTTQETREKKVGMAVMVPLIISHDGAIHKGSVMRWKGFSPDLELSWVRMAQSVLRYNVVIVGKFFNKGSWASDAWRMEHPDELLDEPTDPPERMPTIEERREQLNIGNEFEGAVSVRSPGTPPPHGVRLTPAERGIPNLQRERTNQPF